MEVIAMGRRVARLAQHEVGALQDPFRCISGTALFEQDVAQVVADEHPLKVVAGLLDQHLHQVPVALDIKAQIAGHEIAAKNATKSEVGTMLPRCRGPERGCRCRGRCCASCGWGECPALGTAGITQADERPRVARLTRSLARSMSPAKVGRVVGIARHMAGEHEEGIVLDGDFFALQEVSPRRRTHRKRARQLAVGVEDVLVGDIHELRTRQLAQWRGSALARGIPVLPGFQRLGEPSERGCPEVCVVALTRPSEE
jgi:hypothetical protein